MLQFVNKLAEIRLDVLSFQVEQKQKLQPLNLIFQCDLPIRKILGRVLDLCFALLIQ